MEYSAPEYKEIIEAMVGHIFKDWMDEGIRCLIMRGPVALCAYLGIHENHPFANFNYSEVPLQVHGGLTFGGPGDDLRPKGYKWYGWDYGHSGDVAIYKDGEIRKYEPDAEFWTVKMVESEVNDVIYYFRKLILMAEKALLRKEGYLIADCN